MEELLKEVVLSERRRQQIDSFIEKVTKCLQAVPTLPKVEVCSKDSSPLLTSTTAVVKLSDGVFTGKRPVLAVWSSESSFSSDAQSNKRKVLHDPTSFHQCDW